MVISKLLYGLSSAWLNKAEMRRLDGFYCRCLRAILRIPPSFVSRVSNATVLQQSSQPALGRQLRQQQLLLYGRVARAPDNDVLRKLTFSPGSLQPVASRYIRKVGRPRNEWSKMLEVESWKVSQHAAVIVHDAAAWKRAVCCYCKL